MSELVVFLALLFILENFKSSRYFFIFLFSFLIARIFVRVDVLVVLLVQRVLWSEVEQGKLDQVLPLVVRLVDYYYGGSIENFVVSHCCAILGQAEED